MLFFQRLAWHSIRIVYSMGQVLTLLGLSVADPLRSAVAVLSIDVPALFVHFECHGIKHSYYAGWLVAANSRGRGSAPPLRTVGPGGSAPGHAVEQHQVQHAVVARVG